MPDLVDGQSSTPRPSQTGKVALVTGATSGLGLQAALVLGQTGMTVVATGRSEARLRELETAWSGPKDTLSTVAADVTDEAAVVSLVQQAVGRYGRIDVLVNSAGISDGSSVHSEVADIASFRSVLDCNVVGTFLFARECGRQMLEQGSGSIVNISSMLADGGTEYGPTSYVASKAAVEGMTRQLAIEWAGRGVRVNAIAPNHFITNMTADYLAVDENTAWVKSRTPLRRLGVMEDLAGSLLFLATNDSAYVTGQIIHLDGGFTAARGTYQGDVPWRATPDRTKAS